MSEFERLKELLLADERAALADLARRVADERASLEALPAELPGLIRRAQEQRPDGALGRALVEPVADALEGAVRRRPQSIVDALFPVIGPAIRRSIAEYLRNFVEDFNRVMEARFTRRGIGWWLESRRTGTPYAMVVLKHTLRYKLDHLFLIERDSGLVIHRESAPDLPDLDSDAIAGMLTAIGEFVKDSVGEGEQGALSIAQVGEHVLWLLEGPSANLACFLRGVPTPALRAVLQQRLEELHGRLNDPMSGLQAGRAELGAYCAERLAIGSVDVEARAGDDTAAAQPSRTPALVAALVVLALVAWAGWSGVRSWLWQRDLAALRESLAGVPGFVLTGMEARNRDLVILRGLLDPSVKAPVDFARRQLPPDTELRFETRGYLSTDDIVLQRRAAARVQAPAGVRLRVSEGVLHASGYAPADWIAAFPADAANVAGLAGVDASALRADPAQALRLHATAISGLLVPFAPGAQAIEDVAAVDALVEEIERARGVARTLGVTPRLRCFGVTDEPGSASTNASLRVARAEALVSMLRERLPGLAIERADDAAMATESDRLARRAARAELSWDGSEPP